MGALSSKKIPGQVLLTGPPDSGKTTLLYQLVFQKKDWESSKTTGFQFEIVKGGDGPAEQQVAVWDIAGGQSTSLILPQIYQLVRFQSIVYMISPERIVQEGVGSHPISQLDYARVHLNRLLAEIEMEQINNVHIVYNVRKKKGKFAHYFTTRANEAAQI